MPDIIAIAFNEQCYQKIYIQIHSILFLVNYVFPYPHPICGIQLAHSRSLKSMQGHKHVLIKISFPRICGQKYLQTLMILFQLIIPFLCISGWYNIRNLCLSRYFVESKFLFCDVYVVRLKQVYVQFMFWQIFTIKYRFRGKRPGIFMYI